MNLHSKTIDPATRRGSNTCVDVAEGSGYGISKVLLLGGSFSGATGSLLNELRARGIQVRQVHPSLRGVRLLGIPSRPLLVAAIYVEAFLTYGLRCNRYLKRTRASSWAFGLSSEQTIDAHDVDLVIQIGANHAPYSTRKRPGIVHVVYTDHTNMLSKQLPSFGLHMPERYVSAAWNKIEGRNLALQDHVFVMGSQVRNSMIRDYGLPSTQVSVVGAGPNLDIDIERDGFRKDPHDKNVLFVGLKPERKGLPVLIRAMEQVRRSHPDATLNIVGVDGENSAGVIFHGKLRGEALKQHFYAAQIFAMPSLREPFGLVFLEAMWAKAVCVGTKIGAIPEIITDGMTGFVVEPNEVDGLAERIVHLLDNPELRNQFAERAYRQAQQRWSWSRVVTRMLDTAAQLAR